MTTTTPTTYGQQYEGDVNIYSARNPAFGGTGKLYVQDQTNLHGLVTMDADAQLRSALYLKNTRWSSTNDDILLAANNNSLVLRNTRDGIAGQFESTLTDFNFRNTDETVGLNLAKADGAVSVTSAADNAFAVAGRGTFGSAVINTTLLAEQGVTFNDQLNFGNDDLAAPTLGTRSAGTRVVYRGAVGATTSDYAQGLEENGIWNSIPDTNGDTHFRWYGGDQVLATLNGAGNLTLNGYQTILNATDVNFAAPGDGASLTAAGGAYVTKSLFVGQDAQVGHNLTVQNDLIVDRNAIIRGDLTILGPTTTIESTTTTLADNVFLVNYAPSGYTDGGYGIKRSQTVNDAGTGEIVTSPTPKTSGTAAGGTVTTVTLGENASDVDGAYTGGWIKVTGGTGVNQVRRITDYVGATRVATIATTADEAADPQTPPEGMDFTTVPDATSTYSIFTDQYILTYWKEQENEYVFGSSSINPGMDPIVDTMQRINIRANQLSLEHQLKTNLIVEHDADQGVTIEGVTFKDGRMTGLGSLNAQPVALVDNDPASTAPIPVPRQSGVLLLFVQPVVAGGATGLFALSASSDNGSFQKVIGAPGANGEQVYMDWPVGGDPHLIWKPAPTTGTGALIRFEVTVLA